MKQISIIFTAALLSLAEAGFAQGLTNLNFEIATIPHPTATVQGWTAYFGTSNSPTLGIAAVGYDTVSLGGAAIFLEDSNAPSGGGPLPLQGNYSVLLEGASGVFESNPTTASIGQTGTIPNTAQSLTFFGSLAGNLQVTFNGQPLSFMDISNTLNYAILGADISAYAGQTGQLLFTAPVNSGGMIDNIQFSSLPVPEPSTFALAALGALFLGFDRRKKRLR